MAVRRGMWVIGKPPAAQAHDDALGGRKYRPFTQVNVRMSRSECFDGECARQGQLGGRNGETRHATQLSLKSAKKRAAIESFES